MIKKKTKGKTAGKKTTRKKTSKKPMDPARVREQISGMVKSGAKEITKAVIGQAKHGDLAPAKYLFEMAGVYPAVNDGKQATVEEDCLAKTLLDRLDAPGKVEGESVTEQGPAENRVLESGTE